MPPGFEGQRAFIKIYTLTFSVSRTVSFSSIGKLEIMVSSEQQ